MKGTISTLFPGLEQEYFPRGRATLGFCPSAHSEGNCQTGPYLPHTHVHAYTHTYTHTHSQGLCNNSVLLFIYFHWNMM